MATKRDEQSSNDLPVEFSNPARRALIQAGYSRLDQLATVRETEVKRLHGVGPTAIAQLRRALEQRGLSFADVDAHQSHG